MRKIRSVGIIAAVATALLVAAPNIGSSQNLEEAEALNNKVVELYNAGKYADAIPLAQRVLSIQEKALGPNHPGVATSLNNLAFLYHSQGRYADAERLYQRSLAIREKALGLDHLFVATSLNNLAELYRSEGRHDDAEPLYKRSLVIREKALGLDHPDVAMSLNNLALLYWSLGRYADAEPLYKQSLAIRKKAFGPDHPDVAQSLNNLAALYKTQSRYADAEPLYKRSLAIREKGLGPDHPDVANSLNNLAALYKIQGRYADAEPLFKRSLAIHEKSLGLYHPTLATSLNNLASLYQSQGRYADAESLYKRSLAIHENSLGPNHPNVALSLNNLANLYLSLGRYAEAEPLFKRSLAIHENSLGLYHPDVALSLNNLASLYKDQNRYADAEPFYQRSLAIREKALGPDHPDVANSLNNLADLYKAQGRYADAESLFKRSLAIHENSLGLHHPDVALSLNNLANLYSSLGRYADALPLVKRLMTQNSTYKAVALPIFLGAQSENLISATEAFVDTYYVLQWESSSSAGTAVSTLTARFAAGSDELALMVRKDQDLITEADRLDKNIIAAVSKAPTERVPAVEQRIRRRIEETTSERDKLRAIFDQRFPAYVALSKPQPLTVEQTQALLSDNEALVILDFDAKSYAWILTRANADWVGLNITARELGEQVKALRSSLTFNADKPFDADLAYKLYLKTFGAISDKLQGKTRLSVVTNGALTSLPLQLLVMKDPSHKPLKDVDWFVRSYAITNLPSVASLKTLRSTALSSSAVKPMIAFADPVFSKDQNNQIVARNPKGRNTEVVALRGLATFYEGGQPDLVSLAKALPQLPDTANEVRTIAEILKADKSDLKLGVFASETIVKQTKLDDYRIIYFATHGLVAGEVERFAKVKAEPALALTIPEIPTELDDGLLQASEVAQLKLNADWVVLSACNTAAEEKPGAEALSGLARAFFYAGARSLVVSHWEVDSEATVQLMTSMFQSSAKNPRLSHSEALRVAMLTMIDNAKSDDDLHPRVWAPFVIVGEPAKVK
jgi:CHAT domain-containing protein/Tfp pilus assembly protein PilF